MTVRVGVGIAAALIISLSPALRHVAQPVSARAAQTAPFDLDMAAALTWRPLGPFSAGRVTAIDGDVSRPGLFYAAAAGAGVWRTTDYGLSWTPVFDAPPVGSVSAIAVAASQPGIVYIAAGSDPVADDTRPGSTVYGTIDDGTTWQNVDLPSRQHVSSIAVDPVDHRRLFVAVQAATSMSDGPQGVFRSTDAGVTFERVLDVGITDLAVHPGRPTIVFALRSTPNAHDASEGGGAGLFRSADGGATWQRSEQGLPALGAIEPAHLSLAAVPNAPQAFVLVTRRDGAALYRTDDFGGRWTPVDTPAIPPATETASPQIAMSSSGTIHLVAGDLWESRDGGATFTRTVGFPDGRDDSLVWHHPSMAGVMIVAGRTGAVATVNGGATWSPETSLPTAGVERVSVDTSFPYRICAAQPSITRCTPNRNDRGGSSVHDWQPLPPGLAGPVTPDPLEAEVVFGGDVIRFDRRTGQSLDVGRTNAPIGSDHPPVALAFSPDGRALHAGAQSVWRTINGGLAWTELSPDLTADAGAPARSARISALAVSPIDARTIWAGIDDGRVHVTRDGGTTWTEGQPPVGTAPAAIRWIEPSRFDTNSVYVVVTSAGANLSGPHLLRTRDNGRTWIDIGANLLDAGAIHTVREDPFRRGLLFAGTDRSVAVSFDDGERWQPLQLNLPATPVRDVVIKDADLIVGTGGRGVWVLDDISPLRQITTDIARTNVFLFRPAQAWRVRATGVDAPASSSHASSGAWLTYLLGENAPGDVTLEIIETATGDVIRRFSSSNTAGSLPLPAGPGLRRVFWDLRYPPPEPDRPDRTPGTFVLPGTYQVRLTAGGQTVRQAVSIRMDPRIRTSVVDLTAQRDLGRAIDATRAALHAAIADRRPADVPPGFTSVLDELHQLARVLQRADVRPSARLEAAAESAIARATTALGAAND